MNNEYTRPDKHLAEGTTEQILKTRAVYGQGARNDLPMFYRFVVLETIFDPSIIDSNKISYFEHALGVSNAHLAAVLPRNTIVGQRVMNSTTSAATPPMFLFPFFPPAMSMPCQAGEHVWVMFENPTGTKNDLGYWMCRIVEPGFVEDANHTHPPRGSDPSFTPNIKDLFDGTSTPAYEFRNGRGDLNSDGSRYTVAETTVLPGNEDAYEQLMTTTDAGKTAIYEAVPRFRKRPGDLALEGTNNTLVVLGRDRSGAVATYTADATSSAQVVDLTASLDDNKPGSGAIDVVVGRGQIDATLGKEVPSVGITGSPTGNNELGKDGASLSPQEGDPDMLNDRSRIYIAQRTKPDTNFGLATFNVEMGAGTNQGASIRADATDSTLADGDGDGAIVIKSDKLRLIARSDVEILVVGVLNRDAKGRIVANDAGTDGYAAVVIKANGDIVFRPSKTGYIKLGGDDADKGLVCSDTPVTPSGGVVTGAPLITTMGGHFAGAVAGNPNDNAPALAATQAKFAAKILVK